MKLLRIEYLIKTGSFYNSQELKNVIDDVKTAIYAVKWPIGSSSFTLNNSEPHCNGVVPIKKGCMDYLSQQGWGLEVRMKLGTRKRPGPVDAVRQLSDGRRFAVEWETGNVSSAHRSFNKILIGLSEGILAGGLIIVPSREMYTWLTDRIGNFPELEPYFVIYRDNPSVTDGVLGVVEVEYDNLSPNVPRISKGTDGRALV